MSELTTVHAESKPLSELLSVATAASRSNSPVTFLGAKTRPLEDLVRLVAAGGDQVRFDWTAHPPSARPTVKRRWFVRR